MIYHNDYHFLLLIAFTLRFAFASHILNLFLSIFIIITYFFHVCVFVYLKYVSHSAFTKTFLLTSFHAQSEGNLV